MSGPKNKMVRLSLIVCAMLTLVALGPAGMATASTPASPMAAPASAPTVNSDGTVTFSLKAPGAKSVYLNFQNMLGLSPTYNSYAMTENTSTGVWSITLGPTVPGLLGWDKPPAPLLPNWYGYGFNIDGTPPVIPPPGSPARVTATAGGGVNIPDPANRDIWLGDTSAWSMVMVPSELTTGAFAAVAATCAFGSVVAVAIPDGLSASTASSAQRVSAITTPIFFFEANMRGSPFSLEWSPAAQERPGKAHSGFPRRDER